MGVFYDDAGLKNPNLTPADRIRLGKKGAGRWVYCKYCYKNVMPIIDEDEDLIVCRECGYGLAVLSDVRKAGSYNKWYQGIYKNYAKVIENKEI